MPKQQRAEKRTVVTNPCQEIEEMFSDFVSREPGRWPFDLLVVVAGRLDSPGPRHPRWEFILDMGMPNIEKVLHKKPIGAGPHFFIFPDRWLTPPEAQMFGHMLYQNPDAKKFGRVYVVTHQPYIVGDCLREQVRIMRLVED